MTRLSTALASPELEDRLHFQALFHALVAQYGSIAYAADTLMDLGANEGMVAHEMLQDWSRYRFDEINEILDRKMGSSENSKRRIADIMIAAQRLGIAMQQLRPLAAIAARDNALLEEIASNEARLACGDLDNAVRQDLETQAEYARICRKDLFMTARLLLEQQAIRERLANADIQNLHTAMMRGVIAAARERGMVLGQPAVHDMPLRTLLAAELAMEAERCSESPERSVAAPAKLAAPRNI